MNQLMKGPMDVAGSGEPIVTSIVPRTFILTLANGIPIRVAAGTQEMPKSIANHFYSKANGVRIVEPVKSAEPVAVEPDPVEVKRGPGRPPKAQS